MEEIEIPTKFQEELLKLNFNIKDKFLLTIPNNIFSTPQFNMLLEKNNKINIDLIKHNWIKLVLIETKFKDFKNVIETNIKNLNIKSNNKFILFYNFY